MKKLKRKVHKAYKARKLNKALFCLKKAFEANVEAHKYSKSALDAYLKKDYDLANRFSSRKLQRYGIKSSKVVEAIWLIGEYKLPIKYGYGFEDGKKRIICFSYKNRQISFHFFGLFDGIGKYTDAWNSTVNKKFHFV